MIEQKPKLAFILMFVGVVLIFANTVIIGINDAPIVASSSSIQSPNDAIGVNASASWFRVSLGLQGWVEGAWAPVWLIVTIIMMYCVLRVYIKPLERKTLCLTIALLSAVSIIYGGGFLIGALLGVLGAGMGYAWPVKLENAFFYKIVRAARLDPKFYQGLPQDENSLKHGAYALAMASLLSGIGVGIYAMSTQIVLSTSSTADPFRIVLLGRMPVDFSIVSSAVINLGLGIFKWIILSGIIYAVAVGLIERKQKFSNLAAVVGFAYVPISLQFFMPFVMTGTTGLGFTLPFYAFLLTNAWMILGLIVGVRQVLEVNMGKALGVLSVSGAIYLLIHETFFATLDVPNTIHFAIQPQSALLVVVSSLVVASLLLETYARH